MKDEVINEILRLEGGYVSDPADYGGETNQESADCSRKDY